MKKADLVEYFVTSVFTIAIISVLVTVMGVAAITVRYARTCWRDNTASTQFQPCVWPNHCVNRA